MALLRHFKIDSIFWKHHALYWQIYTKSFGLIELSLYLMFKKASASKQNKFIIKLKCIHSQYIFHGHLNYNIC